ncbi:MAG TPA: PD-(D/E)XK nuclease family protein [Gemmatimonadaceae bacterium]|jgi:hypothetical protein
MGDANRILSVTEMSTFLQCRHKWALTSPSKEALQAKGFPALPLILGTLTHAGLSAHALHQDWGTAVQDAAGEYIASAQHESDEDRIEQAVQEACAWICDYIDEYGDEPFSPLRVIASEQTFTLGIHEPFTGEMLGTLVGTFDYILTDSNNRLYIADTKTYSPQNRPSHEKYALDLQFNTYAWVAQQIFGRCDGVLYDGIEKKHPAKFERFMLRPDAAVLGNIAEQVRHIFREAFSEDFYPLRILGYECNRCPVRDLCFSGLAGEDTEWIERQKYERNARGSRSRGAAGAAPATEIGNLQDFLDKTA